MGVNTVGSAMGTPGPERLPLLHAACTSPSGRQPSVDARAPRTKRLFAYDVSWRMGVRQVLFSAISVKSPAAQAAPGKANLRIEMRVRGGSSRVPLPQYL